jgi:hypothetical protein
VRWRGGGVAVESFDRSLRSRPLHHASHGPPPLENEGRIFSS